MRARAACLVVGVVSGGSAWSLRHHLGTQTVQLTATNQPNFTQVTMTDEATLSSFAHRAAVAHVVYSPDVRRPVR